VRAARTSRWFLVVGGAALVALAIFVPAGWLVGGAAILRVILAVEGGALLTAGALGLRFRPLESSVLLAPPRLHAAPAGSMRGRSVVLALAGITLVALILRVIHLGDDLWLDEIVTVRQYASGSVRHILSSYDNPNNHLLNSLLVHASLVTFGYREWAVRLPALIWGVLTVPAFFWTARQVFRPFQSLAAASLLAVSFQHVFFSQNARGYTASLFFGLAATTLLVKALREDRLRLWALYVASCVLCAAAVPTGAFVVTGHLVVATAVLVRGWRRNARAALSLLGRVTVVYAAVGMLAIQVYAPVIASASNAVQSSWNSAAAGFKPLSFGFVRQLGQGFTSGVGPLLLLVAIPVAGVGLVGAWSLFRRDWALVLGLSLGPLIHVSLVVARGLAFSPRFLLFLAFPAILAVVETIGVVASWTVRVAEWRGISVPLRRATGLEVVGITLVAAVLAAPLARYYRIQKQPYREALSLAVSSSRAVIAADNMEQGVRYYGIEHPGERAPLRPGIDLFFVRSEPALDQALAHVGRREPVVLTTLERALRTGRPLLYARIRADWLPAEHLAGSVGDGGITIWRPRHG
jgi:mannosyltransferase